MRTLAVFLFLFLWGHSGAFAFDDHSGDLQFGLFSEVSDNANASRRIFELRSRFDYESRLTPYLSSGLGVEGLTQSGNITFNFQQRPGPRQGIRVRKAEVNLHDQKRVSELAFGVFDPNDSMRWPYFRPIAFPGANLRLNIGNKFRGAKLNVLQSLAASTVASRDVYENTENPRLTSESLSLYAREKSWEAYGQAFHYRFFDLPSQVAHLSRFDGNTVVGNSPQLTQYVYEYDGFGGSLYGGLYVYKTWKVGLLSAYMENTKAPSGINKGFENSILTQFDIFEDIEVQPSVGVFKKGSDVFPAYYLNNIQNSTNMGGEFARLVVGPKSKKWNLRADFVNGTTIRTTPYQDKMQIVKLSWVQRYEIF